MNSSYYRGRGYDEIFEHVTINGPLVGEIIRITGERVAVISFDIDAGELALKVNGQEFTSVTNALSELYPKLAVNDATGSEGSGNIANNVIGNYAIFKHVVFGKVTLEDIVGTSATGSYVRKTPNPNRTHKVRPVKVIMAKEGFWELYDKTTMASLVMKYGRDLVKRAYDYLTITEFTNMFGI